MNPYYSGLPSDHFDGLRFFNPDGVDTDRSVRDVLRWKLKETAAPWPRSVPVRQTVPDARIAGLRATIVGHASVLIQADGLNVLTDPIWSARASPISFFGPRRVWAPGIAFEALPKIDETVSFKMHMDGELDTVIKGQGVVRWIRRQKDDNLLPGCGIEFVSFEDNGRAKIFEFINLLRTKQYIPKL